MFTGLIQSVGILEESTPTAAGRRLVVDASGWAHEPSPGDSIAVAGCCLTVADQPREGRLVFDVVAETLRRTTIGDREPGDRLNLEHAARADTLLGGHIVQGHIDGVGIVASVTSGDDHQIRIAPPVELLPLIPPKGSIAVEGVSLTIASVDDHTFGIALIPTTLRDTTLGALEADARCNIETDILARTVAHWLERTRA